ncbi:MAG: hypothetical protein KDE35_06010 [Geminicoccaceae bacterium]|nr:hypothetical protein [Geminicoccaceae bacterium]
MKIPYVDFDDLCSKHHVCRITGERIEILAIEDDAQGRRFLVAYEDARRSFLHEDEIGSAYEPRAECYTLLLTLALCGFVGGAALSA